MPHGTGPTPAAIRSSSMASRQGRTRSSSNWSMPTTNRLIKKWYESPFLGGPLLCLQHFMGTLDNWDPAVTDALASGREIILFDNAGVGASTGNVPDTVQGMATHALSFLDSLGVMTCDVLGFSLGGIIAQHIAQDRPSMFRRMILV